MDLFPWSSGSYFLLLNQQINTMELSKEPLARLLTGLAKTTLADVPSQFNFEADLYFKMTCKACVNFEDVQNKEQIVRNFPEFSRLHFASTLDNAIRKISNKLFKKPKASCYPSKCDTGSGMFAPQKHSLMPDLSITIQSVINWFHFAPRRWQLTILTFICIYCHGIRIYIKT